MSSPPKVKSIPSLGASRSRGGITHGRALGNALNIADIDNNLFDDDIVSPGEPAEEGTILFYDTRNDPSEINVKVIKPSGTFTVPDISLFQSMQPILERMQKRHSPVQGKLI
jgi:hypothetical protein